MSEKFVIDWDKFSSLYSKGENWLNWGGLGKAVESIDKAFKAASERDKFKRFGDSRFAIKKSNDFDLRLSSMLNSKLEMIVEHDIKKIREEKLKNIKAKVKGN